MAGVSALAPLLDIFAGAVLEAHRTELEAIPGILILIPPFVSQAGAIGGILSSRLSSKLQLGVITPRGRPERPALIDATIVVVLGLVVFAAIGAIATVLASVAGVARPSAGLMLGGTIVAGSARASGDARGRLLRGRADDTLRARPRQPRGADHHGHARPHGCGRGALRHVSIGGHLMNEPRNVKDLLVELKDASELMVDLAYAAVFFNEDKLAREVARLESRMTDDLRRLRTTAMLAARSPEDAEGMAGVLWIADAIEQVGDAASDIARVVAARLGIPDALRPDLRHADEVTARVKVREGGAIVGRDLRELSLPTETGMWIVAIRSGLDWQFDPGPDDIIVGRRRARGPWPRRRGERAAALAGAPGASACRPRATSLHCPSSTARSTSWSR